MSALESTLTVSLPCPDCQRPPVIHVPVEWEQRGMTTYRGRVNLDEVRLAVAVHVKQHRRSE